MSGSGVKRAPVAIEGLPSAVMPGNDFDQDADVAFEDLGHLPQTSATSPVTSSDSKTAMAQDLAKSGLVPEDVGAYVAGMPELTACKIRLFRTDVQSSPGYVIPYYGIDGKKVPFYRVRMFSEAPGRAKYLQPADSVTHIYYPRRFAEALGRLRNGALPRSQINGHKPTLIICEGEKKAERAMQDGFLAVGLGGVYSWKSRTLVIPDAAKLEHDKSKRAIHVKLPSNADSVDGIEAAVISKWALGFQEIVHLALEMQMNILIVFDSDFPPNPKVQVAAATLGFELRTAGIPITRIRQVVLPSKDRKVALDDYLMEEGPDKLEELVHSVLSRRTAFPSHPSMKAYVNSKLGYLKTRDQAKQLAVSIIADMDVYGARMKDENTGTPFYFDGKTKALMPVNLMHFGAAPLHETDFGRHLFRSYDISQADTRLLPWLASHFTGEDPIFNVQPRSTIHALPNGDIAYQISDGQYALITPSGSRPIRILDNGSQGLLFRGGQVDPVDIGRLQAELTKQLKEPLTPWWLDVLREFKFQKDTDRILATVLFYISPWFLRWNGTQLPVELMIGEPGSGKSSMYMLRAQIITGRAALRNQPGSIRDWYSSITSTDGLHITDNVKFANKENRQLISDEICRLITEPDPYVEQRKLYTTADIHRVPVRSVFAFTAIQQPFTNADIIQRAAIFELNAVGGDHDNSWVENKLAARGGREGWIAHHLVAIHRFLKKSTAGSWDKKYRSKHRLIHYEQLLCAFGEMLGIGSAEYIRDKCIIEAESQVSKYDWIMEGLTEFCLAVTKGNPNASFTLSDVAEWAQYIEDFKDNETLTNARRLAHYLRSHITMAEKVTGLYEVGRVANRTTYKVRPQK